MLIVHIVESPLLLFGRHIEYVMKILTFEIFLVELMPVILASGRGSLERREQQGSLSSIVSSRPFCLARDPVLKIRKSFKVKLTKITFVKSFSPNYLLLFESQINKNK